MVKAEMVADGVGQLVVVVVERALPSTEACQSLVRIMIDDQLRLCNARAHVQTHISASILAVFTSFPTHFPVGIYRQIHPLPPETRMLSASFGSLSAVEAKIKNEVIEDSQLLKQHPKNLIACFL